MDALEARQITDVRQTGLKGWGTSQAVRIPKVLCDRVGIATGSRLTMESGTDVRGPFILIRPVAPSHRSYADAPYVSMDEAFAHYAGGAAPQEADWGDDVGAEVIA